MSISPINSTGYGFMGTPDAGRPERIAAYDRRRDRQYREASERNERSLRRHRGTVADRALLQEVRSLRDANAELRQEIAWLRRELAAIRDETAEALVYLSRTEASRNGTQATH